MRLSGQFQACLFFFVEKVLSAKKAPKSKTSDFHPLRSFFSHIKNVDFVVFCSLVFVMLVEFCLWVFFHAQKLFIKKINKQIWNCPVKLIILYD